MLDAKRYPFRSMKLDNYSRLAENLSKEKRKRDGWVVISAGKSLKLKYVRVIFVITVSKKEEDEKPAIKEENEEPIEKEKFDIEEEKVDETEDEKEELAEKEKKSDKEEEKTMKEEEEDKEKTYGMRLLK